MKRVELFFISIGVAAIFLVLLLLGLHVAIILWGQYKATHHSLTSIQSLAYQHMTNDQIQNLLKNTYEPGFVYEPWLGFKEKFRASIYVNVTKQGTRFNHRNEDPDEKINGAVWFFGGSTTFGYGVADNETIPAQLETLIKKPVVNFGRAFYYSAQENFLLSSLLKSGFKPNSVIFLDGINERCDIDFYQSEFSRIFANTQTYHWDLTEIFKPLFIGAEKLKNTIGHGLPGSINIYSHQCERQGKTLSLSYVMASNLTERKEICDKYALRCHAFVQPFAGMHGVHQDYAMLSLDDRKYFSDKFTDLSSTWRDFGELFITDSLNSLHDQAYIDGVHYTPTASALIAKAIASHMTIYR